ISIPFCPSRCTYCSFVSHSIQCEKSTSLIEDYLTLLYKELVYIGKMAKDLGLKLTTIYIGGGTPTSISSSQLKAMTDVIAKNFPVKDTLEYTIEAGRADTITREKLEVIKACGATRISINPQTFNDNVLVNIGRRHTAAEVVECYQMAREIGFDNINMDLIAGLPTDNFASFKRSVDTCIGLAPENITVHTLSIKRSSKLYEKFSDKLFGGEVAMMVEYSQKVLMNNSYEPYYLYRQKNTVDNLENVGYCKPGKQSYYNIFIMEELQTILAAGAGAVTKLVKLKDFCNIEEIVRIYNYKYHFEYISDFDEIINRKGEVLEFYDKFKFN
ncbi:MAG: coproporphyrinogen dehydrogenase HemZ, partial [Oscillospiraceae bacterium]